MDCSPRCSLWYSLLEWRHCNRLSKSLTHTCTQKLTSEKRNSLRSCGSKFRDGIHFEAVLPGVPRPLQGCAHHLVASPRAHYTRNRCGTSFPCSVPAQLIRSRIHVHHPRGTRHCYREKSIAPNRGHLDGLYVGDPLRGRSRLGHHLQVHNLSSTLQWATPYCTDMHRAVSYCTDIW